MRMTKSKRSAVLKYFSKLGQSNDPDLILDTDHVVKLIEEGADINCRDKYGQTVLHEIARQWHIDVAKYLLKLGAAIDLDDKYGRTPLHVAAAADYPQMVKLLIESGANKEARSKGELHTPVHFAARYDACQSLSMLIKLGCEYKDVQDYKGRTPLHVAAELDRSQSTRYLLEMKASASVTDKSGQRAITWMIAKMPQIALDGLTQFRVIDSQTRKQYFLLQHLVPGENRSTNSTPLHVAVHYKQFQVVTHPSMSRLLDIMWHRFGLLGVWLNFLLNLVYIILWTIQGVLVEYDQRHVYNLPQEWWRIILFLSAVGFTVWQIVEEFLEFHRSRTAHKRWVEWRTEQIQKDMEFTHPRWPDEKAYLQHELEDLNHQAPAYFQDKWNIFDWICYVLLLVCIITHLADVIDHSELLARWHIRIMCVTIILLWLRLMKCARAFTLVGPFIVMLGHMMTDLLRFIFLYLEFYIPYVCAFWMIFGGDKMSEDGAEVVEVEGYENFGVVFFSLFQLTMVDEYDYEHMRLVDSLMTYILLGTWFALSAILCLNLFIALMTNTFQTVYDNAKDNAMMQKAIIILAIWDGTSNNRQEKFLKYIEDKCSPLVEYYDDDVTVKGEDLKKVTLQIRKQLVHLEENWKEKFGDAETAKMEQNIETSLLPMGRVLTNDRFERELYPFKLMLEDMKQHQDNLISSYNKDMKKMLHQLKVLVHHQNSGGHDDDTDGDNGPNGDKLDSSPQTGTDHHPVKKKKKKKKKQLKSVGLLNQEIQPMIDGDQPDFVPVRGLSRPGSTVKLRKRATVNLMTELLDFSD